MMKLKFLYRNVARMDVDEVSFIGEVEGCLDFDEKR